MSKMGVSQMACAIDPESRNSSVVPGWLHYFGYNSRLMSVKLLLGPFNDDEVIWHGDVNVKVRRMIRQSARDLRKWRCLPVAGRNRAVQFCDQCL